MSHLFGVRLDYNLSSADRLFFRGSGSRYHEDVDDWTFESPTPEFRGLHDSDRDRHTWSYTGNWTRTFGQTVFDTQLSTNQFYTLDKNHELTNTSRPISACRATWMSFAQRRAPARCRA